jgi:type I restriction enzyme, R subunit
LVARVYKVDKTLSPPQVTNLDGYINEPAFRNLVPEVVWQKAEYIRKMGNSAVHGTKAPEPEKALEVVRQLAHVLYWAGRTYLRKGAEKLQDLAYDESVIPPLETGTTPASLEELKALKAERDKAEEAHQELESELEALRERLAAIKAENDEVPDTHDWDEAKTRKLLIDVDLHRAGWPLDKQRDTEFEVHGMPNQSGVGYVDYVLWGDDGKPLAVVEAKRTTEDPGKGQQQAKLYADCLEQTYGQRPLIFFTNGYETKFWDDNTYPPRQVAGYYKKDELARLILRRSQGKKLDAVPVNKAIVERYYAWRAIGNITDQFTQARRKALLVMATGSGKTRVAIALSDLLQRASWAKRVLFLADRVSLVNQATNAFKKHLPESSPVNLVTEKHTEGRVYVCTYPTMMGMIDETKGNEARFGVGHFDLIIIDEAHRSVYQKYGAIFRYFDSLLVGLTATPRDDVDKNTYKLFDLEPGMPTDAYELETAVSDGHLVPPRVAKVNMQFPQDGIDYDLLPDEEKEQYESLDWGDDVEPGQFPDKVSPTAINSWLFNENTIDLGLQYLMERGHKVDGGDRLGKTIIFARNHKHAEFIYDRFNHHYPEYKGHFASIIDCQVTYPQSLIDDFSIKDKAPHIAISVDMLDTGIDVPEVVNLVFFKPVYSKIKFWQMIGRGTRTCKDLYGPGQDKADFRVFDFCRNFDFFKEHADGILAGGSPPLGARLFCARVQLLGQMKEVPALDPDVQLTGSIINGLHEEVAKMNRDNFIVKEHLEAVDRFQQRANWDNLSNADRETLVAELAELPSKVETDDIEFRLFDLTALRMQLALAEADTKVFEAHRKRVVEIAMLLEEKTSIPAVAEQLSYLQAIQETEFWEGIDLQMLEDLRIRMRGLMQFIDKKKRTIVYTDFQDELLSVVEEEAVFLPNMTSEQYAKRVESYLRNHLNHIVIHRLRTNQPLTASNLVELEKILVEVGEDEGKKLFARLMEQSGAPSLVHFVRSLVGMDRSAAMAAFSVFLQDQSLKPDQIRFIEMIIDQLTARGVMEASALYEAPFTNLHDGGVEGLFAGKENVITGIFEVLSTLQPMKASGG